MSISESYTISKKAEKCGGQIFYVVTAISIALLVWPGPRLQEILHPLLIVGASIAIICTAVSTIFQNQGNHLLRAAQLSNALGSASGEQVRSDYYNSPLAPSILRLASTTLENTLFTSEILSKMLMGKRVKIAAYACVLLLLLGFRWTSTDLLVVLAQALFSADLVLAWIRMERFHIRTVRVHEHLRQFFLQGGDIGKPNGMAIALAAFTDYECAKDEAAMPLDDSIFKRLNPTLSQRWEDMKRQLNISS